MKKLLTLLLAAAAALSLAGCQQDTILPPYPQMISARTLPRPHASQPLEELPDLEELAQQLTHMENFTQGGLFIYRDGDIVINAPHDGIEHFFESVKAGQSDYFTGIIPMEPAYVTYAIVYDAPQQRCTYLTCTRFLNRLSQSSHEITQINDCDRFWNFTNNEDVSLSLTKRGLWIPPKDQCTGYPPIEDLGPVTTQQAVSLSQRLSYALGDAIFGSDNGIIVQELPEDAIFDSEAECIGYFGTQSPYYVVRVRCEDGVEDLFLVSAHDPEDVLYIEPVNGACVPLSTPCPILELPPSGEPMP